MGSSSTLSGSRSRENSRFRKTVLGNGLTILTERQSRFKSLSVGVWVKAGTRHESLNEAGVSHYLEHMMFKGTKSRSALDIATAVDRVGGEFNAFTARDHTCFHLLLLDRDWTLGLDILIDILMESQFKNEEIERERKVILQEITMIEETPEELAHDLFFERIYQKNGKTHGLGRPILGTAESIKQMSRADLVGYFHRHYRPEQLVVSIAGNVNHDEVLRKLRPLAKENWPGRKARRRTEVSGEMEKPPFQPGFWWIKRSTEQVHLLWGVPGPHYESKERFAAFLLNVYLGGGMSSSLFQEIREKNGLAYSVYSTLCPFVDSGVFSVYAATGTEQVPLCLRLIEECVDKIKKKPLSKKELRVIQDNLKGTILLSSDSVESRMASIAKNEIFLRDYVSVAEVCRMIDEVQPADLQRVAHQLLSEQKRSIIALGPGAGKRLVGLGRSKA